ncbi:MAG: prepilin-type N-terminal cleavage/methylation domain-containing protein [Gemmatimonadetes bacterium]|nr:prepilin-type N-terminal cleavage/methylation domain-containing protein [Gemmatimonadota bacterium]MDA1103766.1 prepilin-type N-terminal cleavage/methylation domain-containing protein [Gemmatimonadota bacterium]
MSRDRKGFTIIELLVVVVLGTMVVGAAMQVLVTNQRTYNAQSAVISGQQSTRMAVEVLFAELREVSPPGGDILAMSSDSIRVRLMRKFSVICVTNFTGQPALTVVRLGQGPNAFAVNDSVFIFADNDEDIDSDDVWIIAQVTAVDQAVTVLCPQDLTPAHTLTFSGQSALFAADSVGLGAPVRSFEEYTFGLTTMAGDRYLARRSGGGDMIPIAGPLRPTGGLEFVYRDADGVVTAVPADVRQIEVTIRTGSTVLNSLGRMVSDSVNVWIYTRN